MGPLAQFLLALTNLVRSGAIRKIPQAIKFAELQFGTLTPLLRKQIEKVFESSKKPTIGKPGKKEQTLDKRTKDIKKIDEQGIKSLDEGKFVDDKGEFTEKAKDIFKEGIEGLAKGRTKREELEDALTQLNK